MDSKSYSDTEMSTKKPTASEDEGEDEEEEESYYKSVNVADLVNIVKIFLDNFMIYSGIISEKGEFLRCRLMELVNRNSTTDIPDRIKAVEEAATIFKVMTTAMINTCDTYLELAQQLNNKWLRILEREWKHTNELEFIVQQLMEQYSNINFTVEYQCPGKNCNPLIFISDTNYKKSTKFQSIPAFVGGTENSVCMTDSNITVKSLQADKYSIETGETNKEVNSNESYVNFSVNEYSSVTRNKTNTIFVDNLFEQNTYMVYDVVKVESESKTVTKKDRAGSRNRRKRIPDRPNHSLSLWSVMKNCIGKDLSKIPMPVNFSEPLSMLQRLVETFEYSEILDQAVQCTDVYEQMAYVAAFTISNYSTTVHRSAKPFNPLLGETYEFDRSDDLGWKVICEQVSHHPPIAALHCEADQWTCWQEFTMSSKFRGKYLQIIPLGIIHLRFHATGYHYTWTKVITTVHNIIVGKLWVDQHGEMEIINHTNGTKCHLNYVPYSYFTRETQRRVKGTVMNKEGEAKWLVNGTWDSHVDIARITNIQGTANNPIYKTDNDILAWNVRPPPDDCEKYYNFTIFACQLNEMEEGVAPTDTRRRPDQRLMEEGLWPEANLVKVQLEDKQRAARKRRAEAVAESGGPKPQSVDLEQPSVSWKLEKEENDSKTSLLESAEKSELSVFEEPTTSRESNTTEEESDHSIETYQPTWFVKKFDQVTNTHTFTYKGGYWEAKEKNDWSMCPDIYL